MNCGGTSVKPSKSLNFSIFSFVSSSWLWLDSTVLHQSFSPLSRFQIWNITGNEALFCCPTPIFLGNLNTKKIKLEPETYTRVPKRKLKTPNFKSKIAISLYIIDRHKSHWSKTFSNFNQNYRGVFSRHFLTKWVRLLQWPFFRHVAECMRSGHFLQKLLNYSTGDFSKFFFKKLVFLNGPVRYIRLLTLYPK